MQNTTPATKPRQIIRRAVVRRRIAASDMTIYRWEKKGLFPKRIVLGPHSVGWYEDEIDAWIDSRKRQSDSGCQSPNPKAKRHTAEVVA